MSTQRSEKAIQAALVEALHQLGCHVSSTSQYRPSKQALGLPDLYVMWPSKYAAFWIEVKRPGFNRSPTQVAWATIAAGTPVPVLVIHSVAELLAELTTAGLLPRPARRIPLCETSPA